MSKRTLIASCVVGAFALGNTAFVSADPLTDLKNEEVKIQKAAAKSQEKINNYFEQSQELLVEYRQVLDSTENLKIYNDYLANLVADQQRGIDSLQRQIDSIEETKQNIVPLMFKMIDSLEQFINLDVPINLEERIERVQRLRDLMQNSNVTVAERFRQVLEAYQTENEYGSLISTYQGNISDAGTEVTVDFFNLGRTALLALSLDQKNAWVWDNNARSWEKLGDEYLDSVIKSVRMAQNLVPYDLIKLPIKAAE
ncbi:DUF3450 domain-containing protein [Glaciecola sp. KUL10]|uniref:DUF3450 domain-containing protein n=1 Tax=Glaciecola sp. (strain KUL10) TaxID=2161813 RepID=UPI000D78ACDC|nr:DUF3450 domain-containing protein [Glaciecola sp. KUL10]GBL03973.1 TonB system biopolymer transport component [Glaciecola sp. KUL10]